eukprot:3150083-Amphidinium_carterae.1
MSLYRCHDGLSKKSMPQLRAQQKREEPIALAGLALASTRMSCANVCQTDNCCAACASLSQ